MPCNLAYLLHADELHVCMQAPSLCKLEAGSASDLPPSDVSRLHRALNVVLQRPYIPSQQMAEGAGDYASQRWDLFIPATQRVKGISVVVLKIE